MPVLFWRIASRAVRWCPTDATRASLLESNVNSYTLTLVRSRFRPLTMVPRCRPPPCDLATEYFGLERRSCRTLLLITFQYHCLRAAQYHGAPCSRYTECGQSPIASDVPHGTRGAATLHEGQQYYSFKEFGVVQACKRLLRAAGAVSLFSPLRGSRWAPSGLKPAAYMGVYCTHTPASWCPLLRA